jgi:hypothetical protein
MELIGLDGSELSISTTDEKGFLLGYGKTIRPTDGLA